jgi:ABC-type polysaccharide/polyol phosphate transport system ATPase subunit
VEIFNTWIGKKKPVVFLSYDRRLIRRFANRKVLITKGTLTTIDVKQAAGEP